MMGWEGGEGERRGKGQRGKGRGEGRAGEEREEEGRGGPPMTLWHGAPQCLNPALSRTLTRMM